MAPGVQAAYHPQPAGSADPDSPDYDPRMDPGSSSYDQTYDPDSPYYIDRRGTSDTSGQVQSQAEQQVDQEIEDSGLFGRLFGIFTRNGRVDDAYTEELSDQAQQLAQGVQTRPAPAIPNVNYLAYQHPQLREMVTQNVNPAGVQHNGDLWINVGNAMTKFQHDMGRAINNSEADWQGSGGDAARRFMAGVGNWVGAAGQSAQLAGTQTQLHAQAVETAKNSMPEPVPWDRDAAIRDVMTTGNPGAGDQQGRRICRAASGAPQRPRAGGRSGQHLRREPWRGKHQCPRSARHPPWAAGPSSRAARMARMASKAWGAKILSDHAAPPVGWTSRTSQVDQAAKTGPADLEALAAPTFPVGQEFPVDREFLTGLVVRETWVVPVAPALGVQETRIAQ